MNARWTREQDLAVLHLKLGRVRQGDPDILRLAEALERTEGTIWMRKCNFDYLDPSVSGGLSHYGKLTAGIWAEYEADPGRLQAAARRAYVELTQRG